MDDINYFFETLKNHFDRWLTWLPERGDAELLIDIFKHKLSLDQVSALIDSISYSLREFWVLKNSTIDENQIEEIDLVIKHYKSQLASMKIVKDMLERGEFLYKWDESLNNRDFSVGWEYFVMSWINQLEDHALRKVKIIKLEIDWKTLETVDEPRKYTYLWPQKLKVYLEDVESWKKIDPLTHESQWNVLWDIHKKAS